MITDVVQEFWEAMQQGDFITEAAEKAGTYRKMGARLEQVGLLRQTARGLPQGHVGNARALRVKVRAVPRC